MSDLDESRRYGRPTGLQQQKQHRHEDHACHLSQLSSSPDLNRSSFSQSHNRWPSASARDGVIWNREQQQQNGENHEYSLPDQHQHDTPMKTATEGGNASEIDLPTISTPLHIIQQGNLNKPQLENNQNHTHHLDGELSGLQAAAAKTALVFGGKVVKKSHLDGVITMEDYNDETYDGEDERGHWIFRRHVGFATTTKIEPVSSKHLISDRQHLKNDFGMLRHHHGDHHIRKLSSNGIYQHTKIFTSPSQKEQNQSEPLQPLEALENEKEILLNQLSTLRKQRQQIRQITVPSIQQHTTEWNYHFSTMQHSHQVVMSNLQSLQNRRIWMEEEFAQATKWHVLGDVFLIWHRGAFGTINGMRLGRSAVTSVGLVKRCAEGGSGAGNGSVNDDNGGEGTKIGNGGNSTITNNSAGMTSPSSGVSSLFSWGNATETNNHGTGTLFSTSLSSSFAGMNGNSSTNGNSSNNNATSAEKVIIPWTEINSALGQIVFLLYTLQHTPFSNITFRKHALQPLGSASKIGFMKKSSSSSMTNPQPHPGRRRITALASYYTPQQLQEQKRHQEEIAARDDISWYNLHHYEENGSLLTIGYYARRNFNIALEGLLYCIAEAFLVVEKRDMALAAPYVISVGGLVVGAGASKIKGGGGSSSGSSGEATVGGLPVAYDPSEGERWTAVCKYLLTDLKWLIAYAAKHLDR